MVARLTSLSPLPMTLRLVDGRVIATYGDAVSMVAALPEEERLKQHWQLAQRLLKHCLNSPDFLEAAATSLHTALLMDGLC
jgi:hypothetical protein